MWTRCPRQGFRRTNCSECASLTSHGAILAKKLIREENQMLVLSRKTGEQIVIGDNISITVSRISGNRVSIGVEAPSHMKVLRGELKQIRDEFVDDDSSHALPLTFDIDTSSPVAPH